MLEILLAFTIHSSEADYNQLHPHVRFTQESIISGAYYNSLDRVSFYAGLRHGDRYWIEYGAVTGYRNKISPMARAGANLSDHLSVFVSPMHDNQGLGGLVGMELRFGLD